MRADEFIDAVLVDMDYVEAAVEAAMRAKTPQERRSALLKAAAASARQAQHFLDAAEALGSET